jgi:DNA-binding transcriptional LysR family regulator
MPRIGDRGEMEAFVRSVELGSFSAAARELKLTPSALSKLVSRLERALKVKLVHRTTRRISPTAEGELFRERCRRILADMEDAEMELGRSRERPRGRLRMHVGVGIGMHLIVPVMPRFFARYPEVEIDLWIEDRRVDLVRENIDISVYLAAPETTSLVVRKLFEFERVVCASPAYLRRHGTPRSPDDLARYRCLSVSSVPDHSRWSFRTPTGARVIEMAQSARINNVEAVYRFALAGMGIVRLAEYVVADALRDGSLVEVLSDFHCPEHLPVLVAYPPERHRLPRVAAMLEFLDKTFAGRPRWPR